VKDELIAIGTRKDELEAQLRTSEEAPPLLHLSMADLYRGKVEELAAALEREDTRLQASEMLRGLIDSNVMTPEKGSRLRAPATIRAPVSHAEAPRAEVGCGSNCEETWPRC
jgi:hypothetical protein